MCSFHSLNGAPMAYQHTNGFLLCVLTFCICRNYLQVWIMLYIAGGNVIVVFVEMFLQV